MLAREGFNIEALGCNRIKPAELLAAPLLVLTAIATLLRALRRLVGTRARAYAETVHCELRSPATMFGESLIVAARLRP